LQLLFEAATTKELRALWDLVSTEQSWFNWIGHEWDNWCLQHPAANDAQVPEKTVGADYQGKLSEMTAALAKKDLHNKITTTLAGAPKSKYNAGKQASNKEAKPTAHETYTMKQVTDFMKGSEDESRDVPMWDIIKKNWASTVGCQDNAYLIHHIPTLAGCRSWGLNTPTTVDRVTDGIGAPAPSEHWCRFTPS
jgi:hypothetical protein